MTIPKNKSTKSRRESIIKYSGLSVKMALPILGGVYGGKALDQRFNFESPVFTLILSLLGLTVAILVIINDTIGFSKKK